uniref:Transposase n=1 Tax=Heterorhabditis bacteriophora TaxID=37862 RepID=A0A1I7WDA2_HETBA
MNGRCTQHQAAQAAAPGGRIARIQIDAAEHIDGIAGGQAERIHRRRADRRVAAQQLLQHLLVHGHALRQATRRSCRSDGLCCPQVQRRHAQAELPRAIAHAVSCWQPPRSIATGPADEESDQDATAPERGRNQHLLRGQCHTRAQHHTPCIAGNRTACQSGAAETATDQQRGRTERIQCCIGDGRARAGGRRAVLSDDFQVPAFGRGQVDRQDAVAALRAAGIEPCKPGERDGRRAAAARAVTQHKIDIAGVQRAPTHRLAAPFRRSLYEGVVTGFVVSRVAPHHLGRGHHQP